MSDTITPKPYEFPVQNIFHLPQEIVHDTFKSLMEWHEDYLLSGIEMRQIGNNTTAFFRKPPAMIYCMGHGGDVSPAFSIVDYVKAHNIRTILNGTAYSANALIFMAGYERFVFPRSRLAIHKVSRWGWVDETGKEALTDAVNMMHLDEIMIDVLAETCEKPRSYWIQAMEDAGHGFTYLSADKLIIMGAAYPFPPTQENS